MCYVFFYRLFCCASSNFQFYFVSLILHYAVLMFSTQVAATSDITENKCTALKNWYDIFSHTKMMQLVCFFSLHLLIGHLISYSKWVTDTSWKLRLQCGVQFLWCVLAPRNQTIIKNWPTFLKNPSFPEKDGIWHHNDEANDDLHPLPAFKWIWLWVPGIHWFQLRLDEDGTNYTPSRQYTPRPNVMPVDFHLTISCTSDFVYPLTWNHTLLLK